MFSGSPHRGPSFRAVSRCQASYAPFGVSLASGICLPSLFGNVLHWATSLRGAGGPVIAPKSRLSPVYRGALARVLIVAPLPSRRERRHVKAGLPELHWRTANSGEAKQPARGLIRGRREPAEGKKREYGLPYSLS